MTQNTNYFETDEIFAHVVSNIELTRFRVSIIVILAVRAKVFDHGKLKRSLPK